MSELSKWLGLDKHPELEATINSALQSAANGEANALLPGTGAAVLAVVQGAVNKTVSNNTTTTANPDGTTTTVSDITEAQAVAIVTNDVKEVAAWAFAEGRAHGVKLASNTVVETGVEYAIGLLIPLLVRAEYAKFGQFIDDAIELQEKIAPATVEQVDENGNPLQVAA